MVGLVDSHDPGARVNSVDIPLEVSLSHVGLNVGYFDGPSSPRFHGFGPRSADYPDGAKRLRRAVTSS